MTRSKRLRYGEIAMTDSKEIGNHKNANLMKESDHDANPSQD